MKPTQLPVSSALTDEIVTAIPGRDARPLTVTVGGDMTGDIAASNIIKNCTGVTVHDYHGAILNTAARPVIQRLAQIPHPLRPLRDFLDREEPLRLLVQELRPAGGAWIHGAHGCGRTALLRQLTNTPEARALPDGVTSMDGESQSPHLDEILMRLFNRFYTSDVAVRVDPETARTCLGELQALFVLDDLPLDLADLHALVDGLTSGAVFITTAGRGDNTLMNLSLDGLPRANAIALCARVTQLDTSDSELAGLLDRLCSTLGDLPLPLLLASYLIKSQGELAAQTVSGQHTGAIPADQSMLQQRGFIAQIVGILEEMTTEREALARAARLILQGLSDDQRAVLAALARVGGNDADLAAIANISQLTATRTSAVLAHLIDLRLLDQTGERYTFTSASLRTTLDRLLPAGNERQRAAAFFALLVPLHVGELGWLGRECGNLMAALEVSLKAGQAHQAGLLARAVQPMLVLRGLWSSWGQVTSWASAAAQASGDQALAAWALHDQGTRAGLLGDHATAAANLEQARQLRQALGDRSGAAASRHNMEYLHLVPPPLPARRLSTWMKSPVFWIGMALLVLIIAIPSAKAISSLLNSDPVVIAPTSTSTPIPTVTALPATTAPVATITAVATHTSTPTALPTVTNTPTPIPPTDTPLPPPTDTPPPAIPLQKLTIISLGGQVEAEGIDCRDVCSYNLPSTATIILHVSPDDNATFTGWTGPCKITKDTCTVLMDAAKTVQAHFQFTLTITSLGGTVTSDDAKFTCTGDEKTPSCSFPIEAGSTVTLYSTANRGGSFIRWEDAQGHKTSRSPYKVTMKAPQQVRAIFAFPLTTQINNGTITVTGAIQLVDCTSGKQQNCKYNVEVGAPLKLVARSNPGSLFITWRGGCDGQGPTCEMQMPVGPVNISAIMLTSKPLPLPPGTFSTPIPIP